jgi:hypothetical protein
MNKAERFKLVVDESLASIVKGIVKGMKLKADLGAAKITAVVMKDLDVTGPQIKAAVRNIVLQLIQSGTI